MVKDGDVCPTCNKGTLVFKGGRINQGFDDEPSKSSYEATQLVCNSCNAKWTAHTHSFKFK